VQNENSMTQKDDTKKMDRGRDSRRQSNDIINLELFKETRAANKSREKSKNSSTNKRNKHLKVRNM
jgi:hypothetical protein